VPLQKKLIVICLQKTNYHSLQVLISINVYFEIKSKMTFIDVFFQECRKTKWYLPFWIEETKITGTPYHVISPYHVVGHVTMIIKFDWIRKTTPFYRRKPSGAGWWVSEDAAEITLDNFIVNERQCFVYARKHVLFPKIGRCVQMFIQYLLLKSAKVFRVFLTCLFLKN